MYDISFPLQSNCADFNFAVGINDKTSNDPIDLTGRTIKFDICDQDGCALIAITSDDLIQKELGIFWWSIPKTTMARLCPGTYQTGCTIVKDDDGQITQLSVGPLPINNGNVR